MLLSIAFFILVSLLNIDNIIDPSWVIFIITVAGVESVIGLGIVAAFYWLRESFILLYKPLLSIITLSLLGSIVSGFFGRKVRVCGAQLITCYNVIATRRYNTIHAFEFNSFDTNRNVNYILYNKVYFSTSSRLNLVDSHNLKPAVIYLNADINKKEIFKENNKKSGVYRWTNLNTGFSYVGSSVNLSKRFTSYYSYSFLAKNNMIIYKALLKYGYSNFKLEILEYCAPKECIEREQYYLDSLKPEYNIFKIAGSSLGHKHTEETLAKFKERKFSPDHLKKLKAHLTILNKNQSEEQKLAARERMLKLNEAKGIRVEVTDLRTNEITVYNSLRKTAEALSTDLKALRYNENIQKERGITVPFKKQYLVKIKRDSV